MTRTAYYRLLKAKARKLRDSYGLTTPRVLLSDIKRIYKAEGIKIDYWKGKLKRVRGQYMVTEDGPCVMVAADLPDEQRIFTLAHELKHHFFDSNGIDDELDKDASEIGAEVFAVELIFPDDAFVSALIQLGVGVGSCTREDIVRLKDQTKTTLSYQSLAKRAEFLGYAAKGGLQGPGWLKLRDAICGEPLYVKVQRYRKHQIQNR